MKKTEKVSMTSLFLILLAGLGLAGVTSVTWNRTFTFEITGSTTTSATANFQAYSDSGCTSSMASGGTESLGGFAPNTIVAKNFYIKDASGVGGNVHWAFGTTSVPAGYIGGGMKHVHADGSLHELESHTIGATECLAVRLSISPISPYNNAGSKSVQVQLGRA